MGFNDGLSQEELKQLASVLEEAKKLADRQLEIVEKVLAYEKEIGTLRIGYLKEYFGTYEQALQKVANKQDSLGETLLVYQRQLENFVPGDTGSSGSKKKKRSGKKSGGTADITKKSGDPENYDMDHAALTAVDNDGDTAASIEKMTELRIAAEKKLAQLRAHDSVSEQQRFRKLKKEREDWEETRDKLNTEQQNKFFKKVQDTYEAEGRLIALKNEASLTGEEKAAAVKERVELLSISRRQKIIDAEIEAQERALDVEAQIAYFTDPKYAEELTATSDRGRAAEYDQKDAEKKAAAFERKKAQLELEYRTKNKGILTKKDQAELQARLKKEFASREKNEKALAKQRATLDKINLEKLNAAERDELREGVGALTKKGASFAERKAALYDLTHDADGNVTKESIGKAMSAAVLAVSDLAKQLEGKIDEIAGHKGAIDTRLQGSNNNRYMGSYWDQLVRDMTSVGAVNPFFKQEDFAKNIETLVAKGISFDLKQRAFLMTVSDKIASTFDVSNATLLRLVRIQQEDSTAGRMGMESALNSFLNNMYETSEYLSDVAGSVKSSLEEMESLMKGAEATEVEFQVQKWLGSLYSVGMSQGAVTSIADALGKIAAGDIDGLTNGGAGNLLIMAANDAGLSIADILTDGINSSDTNKLLQASVNYLAELAESAADNKVVQQQLANVFGVKASDLRAATNLVLPGTTKDIYGNNMTYGNMISQLSKMASSMGSRTSMAEMMTNFWENGQYTLAGSMASNPVSYFIYKMAKVVDDAAGGIDLPFLNVMGFGVDLNTTVSDLMRVAAVGGGILGSLGPLVSGLGSSFSGRAMLNKLGIGNGSGLATVTRGGSGGGNIGAAGGTTSEFGGAFAGNSSGSDVKDSTIQESEDSKKQQMIEAKEEEEANKVDVLNQTVLQIYEILNDVANGDKSFKVKVEGYGLTKAGSSSTGALGGVNGAGAAGGNGISNAGNGGGGSANGGGVGGSLDLGGWTTI